MSIFKEALEDGLQDAIESGGVLVHPSVAKERKSICDDCDRKVSLMGVINICGECKCIIAIKTKLERHFEITQGRIIKTECPLNKW
jgi:hypothetical protein